MNDLALQTTASLDGAFETLGPPPDITELVAREMRLLRRQFVDGIPERMRRIDDAWQGAQEELTDDANLCVLYRLVHSLAGTSATLGFEALSATARGLEHYLCSLVNNARVLTLDQCTQIDIWLHIIRRVAHESQTVLAGAGAAVA